MCKEAGLERRVWTTRIVQVSSCGVHQGRSGWRLSGVHSRSAKRGWDGKGGRMAQVHATTCEHLKRAHWGAECMWRRRMGGEEMGAKK